MVETEVPSDEAFATVLLALAAAGNIKTESLRAFSEAEFRNIVSSLP